MIEDTEIVPLPSVHWTEKFSESSAPEITAWKLARSAIEHENNLVNHRMTWFLGIQGFLFSAFVLIFVAWTKKEMRDLEMLAPLFLVLVGCFAAFFAIVTHFGLKRAYLANVEITIRYRGLCKAHPPDPIVPPLHYWGKPAVVNYHHLPVATIFLWIVIIFSCIGYSFSASREFIAKLTMDDALYFLGLLLCAVFGYALRGTKFGKASAGNDERYTQDR